MIIGCAVGWAAPAWSDLAACMATGAAGAAVKAPNRNWNSRETTTSETTETSDVKLSTGNQAERRLVCSATIARVRTKLWGTFRRGTLRNKVRVWLISSNPLRKLD
jgi:hypothetical protein